jgi:hypothetical protein
LHSDNPEPCERVLNSSPSVFVWSSMESVNGWQREGRSRELSTGMPAPGVAAH